ncbi:hypothetical protein [Lishizhenia tianjinensis]|nr:hypothetical protein [Lishizhenia tianjinensis]
MKDSNKSFKDWWEIIHLICHSKKSYSINEIYRISQQTRYETVYHMVLKIRQEMGKINQIESSQYYTPIRFDKRKQSRQNYTRMTPYHLIVTYKKTKGRKQDKIRLTLSKSGRKKLILALKKCSSNYPFPKLLHANNTLKTTELKCLEKCPILPKWENKLRNNIIKLIKGTYHQLQTLHLQGVLDEYSFKYNYRYALNTKGELFISKALIYL